MGAAMQAESVQVHDSAHATEWQALLMAVATDILAAMRQETTAAAHWRAYGRLQRGKGDDRCHGVSHAVVRGWRELPLTG